MGKRDSIFSPQASGPLSLQGEQNERGHLHRVGAVAVQELGRADAGGAHETAQARQRGGEQARARARRLIEARLRLRCAQGMRAERDPLDGGMRRPGREGGAEQRGGRRGIGQRCRRRAEALVLRAVGQATGPCEGISRELVAAEARAERFGQPRHEIAERLERLDSPGAFRRFFEDGWRRPEAERRGILTTRQSLKARALVAQPLREPARGKIGQLAERADAPAGEAGGHLGPQVEEGQRRHSKSPRIPPRRHDGDALSGAGREARARATARDTDTRRPSTLGHGLEKPARQLFLAAPEPAEPAKVEKDDARRDVFHRGGMAQGDVEESGLHRRVGIRHMQAGDAYHVRHSRSQARPGLVRAGSERERTTRASETSPPSRRGRGAPNRFWGEAAPLLPQTPPPH